MLAAMADQEYQDAFKEHEAAVNASIKAQNDLNNLIEESGSDKPRLRKAALHAIRSVKAAGVASVKLEKVKAKRSLQAAGESENAPQDGQNDGTRINDHNDGVYPFVAPILVIVVYFALSARWCYKNFDLHSNKDGGTVKWVNVLYFLVVATFTIGYGDIYPTTPEARIRTIVMVLAGILISYMGQIVIDNFKSMLMKSCFTSVRGWKRDVLFVVLSFVALLICILIGMIGIVHTEHRKRYYDSEQEKYVDYEMNRLDAFYLSVLTLTTVGFGDCHFRLMAGRGFAILWILFCVPIFTETSKFIAYSFVKLWRYIVKAHLKNLVSGLLRDHLAEVYILSVAVILLSMVFFGSAALVYLLSVAVIMLPMVFFSTDP